MDFDFFTPAYEYKCLVGHTADGDTLDLVADLGLRASLGERVRLYGVNTPERGQPGYKEATDRLHELTFNQLVVAHTIKPVEKYGRWLASLRLADGRHVSDILIAEGLGVPYFGGTRTPV